MLKLLNLALLAAVTVFTDKRANVARAWATSRRTVYLVYPIGTKIPKDKFGHWAR